MKIALVALFAAFLGSDASAQRPPYPDQRPDQGQYQDQYQDQRQDQYQDQQERQGRWEYQQRVDPPRYTPQPRCPGRCAPPPRCPRTSCQPPRPRQPDCQVIMLDCYDRVVYRYPGLADYPSGLCAGPLRQCNLDIRREGHQGARCVQTRR